jgi:hypothetical protein
MSRLRETEFCNEFFYDFSQRLWMIPAKWGCLPDDTTTWKGKVVPVLLLTEHHALNEYWGSGGIAVRILDLDTRCRWVVSFTPRQLYLQGKSSSYPLDRRLDGPQSRSGCSGKEKNSHPLSGLEHPIIQPVAQRYTTEVSRFLGPTKPPIKWVTRGSLPGDKTAGARRYPPTSLQCRGQECVVPHLHPQYVYNNNMGG